MTVFTAYYDASGTLHDKGHGKPLVVGAVISTVQRWLRFEREWEAALKEFDAPYLHMKEFAHSTGAFTSWKGDEVRRSQFLGQLVRVVDRNVMHGLYFRVMPDDFRELDREYRLIENWRNAYSFAAFTARAGIMEWMDKHYPSDACHHVFEHGDTGQEIILTFDRMQHGGVTVVRHRDERTGKYVRPLEAADLLAYESRSASVKMLTGQGGPNRKPFELLAKTLALRGVSHNRASLRRMFEFFPERYPRRVNP